MFRLFLAIGSLIVASSIQASAIPLPKSQPPAEPEIDASVRVPDAPAQLGPFAFNVYISLSPAAARLLATKKEQMKILVSYFGEPTKAAKRFADPSSGMITLADEEVSALSSAKTVAVSGRKVVPAQVARIADEAVQVNVNAASARLSGPDNVLNCDFFEGSLFAARESGVNIACKLLTE